MRKHRITDADAANLLSGHTPQGRPELEVLAHALSEFRAASFETPPRPSAALSARLDVGSMISDSKGSAFNAETIETTSPSRGNRPRKGAVRTALAWIVGLSLGLKILLGATVAAAAAVGAGAAGVLPFGAQQTFDEVVSVVIPAEPDDGIDDGTGTVTDDSDVTEGYDPEAGNFGSWVSDQAKNKPDTGRNFGELVSEEAHNKPHPGATDESEVEEGDSDESGDDAVSHGNGPKKDHTPASGKGTR